MVTSYRFLDFELCPSAHRLTQDGKPIDLRPKTFATLRYLIENRDRVVAKEELLDEIWPGVFVQEQAVFQSISELRSILNSEICIKTTRGQGYQWTAETRVSRPGPELRQSLVAIAASLVAVLIGILYWTLEPPSEASTIIIHPTTSTNVATEAGFDVTFGMNEMLIQHLRRMGWRAYSVETAPDPSEALNLMTQVTRTDAGIDYQYVLRGNLADYSGRVVSPTPLGAIRDLASEIHPFLSSTVESQQDGPSVNYLFARAQQHLNDDELSLAEAYLRVILAEQPDYNSAKVALAMAYKQTGRLQDARALAYSAYQGENESTARPDRMVSALLLSQILLSEGAFDESESLANEALELGSQTNDLLVIAEAQEQLGEISLSTGRIDAGKEQLILAREFYSSFCPSGETRVSRRLLELQSLSHEGAVERSVF